MDPILYWNDVALEANRVSHTNEKGEQRGPTLSSRALAIVHLAMYDAFVGASQAALSHYLTTPQPPAASSVSAAVAAAAHATLSHLFPSQKPFFDLKHAQAGVSGANVADLKKGHEFGLLVAKNILDERKDDPGAGDDGYASSMAYGAHRPDPDNPDQGYHAPFYGGGSALFAVTDRHELDEPPQPTDPGDPNDPASYLSALRQVRGQGCAPELMGALPAGLPRRTPNQTVRGIYWGYDGASGLGTPPRLYNQIVRWVAENVPHPDNQGGEVNTPEQNARLFALVNVAMADAGILAWDQKYIHDLWRPVVGIREHDESMGPTGMGNNAVDDDCDPLWLPLGAPLTNKMDKNFTPHFPAYPSGHATFGAAAFQITRLFYGVDRDSTQDDLFKDQDGNDNAFVSDELNGVNKDNKGTVRPKHARTFGDGLWRMIVQNGRSRVDLGVHWVFDAFALDNNGQPDLTQNIGGVPLGLKIAEDIFDHDMQPSQEGPRD
jgi:Vanadium chloroperoxidase N-terminal domain